jgi:hypothetical protein
LWDGNVRFHQLIAVACLTFVCALAPAYAEKHLALVIGDDRCAGPSNEQLQKGVNDALAVGGALRQIGFDVISDADLARQTLLARLEETAQRLATGDAVFFFSDHGVAVDGFFAAVKSPIYPCKENP